jgi:predicted phosphodiesterase
VDTRRRSRKPFGGQLPRGFESHRFRTSITKYPRSAPRAKHLGCRLPILYNTPMPKTVVFSDTHLTQRFDQKQFDALYSLISSADQVIINGDFWDSYETTFDSFIKSPWNQLFPLLKSKHTIYLYGNHDPKKYCDDRVSLFSDIQADHYLFQNLYLCHGHQFAPRFSKLEKSPLFPLLYKLNQANHWLEELLSPISPYFIGHLFFYRHLDNRPLLHFAKTQLPPDQILVCGHSHAAYFSPKDRYINDGDIYCHRLTYLEISSVGAPNLVKKTY